MKDLHNFSSEGQDGPLEGKFIQHKGRFQVTSADVVPKVNSSSNIKEHQFSEPPRPTLHAVSFLPFLQFCLRQNDMQKEQLIKLIRCLEQPSGLPAQTPSVATSELSQLSFAPSREKELQAYAAHLQQSVDELSEEVQRLKMETAQLERTINALKNQRE